MEWVPYQRPTFVTPAFPGYVSGHSTFSRAAAEVLTSLTGSEYFPGGLGTWTIPAGALEFEAGPTTDIPLQWATYYDAADQAGLSRIYGGIHPPVDDLTRPSARLAMRQGRLADGEPLLGRQRPRLTVGTFAHQLSWAAGWHHRPAAWHHRPAGPKRPARARRPSGGTLTRC